MNFVNVRVDQLVGSSLDWAVADALDYEVSYRLDANGGVHVEIPCLDQSGASGLYYWEPTGDKQQLIHLIEGNEVSVEKIGQSWVARVKSSYGDGVGSSPELSEAVCRAICLAYGEVTAGVPVEIYQRHAITVVNMATGVA